MLVRFASAKLSTFYEIHNICAKKTFDKFAAGLGLGLADTKDKSPGQRLCIGVPKALHWRCHDLKCMVRTKKQWVRTGTAPTY